MNLHKWLVGPTTALVLLCSTPAQAAPTTVYAGGGNGVFVSTNGGVTWTNLLANVEVLSLAINPLNPDVIYAGAEGAVYTTTDGGAHWTMQTSGLSTTGLAGSLQINPENPNIVYAGLGVFAGGGVYESTDAGVHWTAMDNGLTGPGLSVRSIAMDPLNPTNLWVTGDFGFVSSKTTNGGVSWTSVNFPGGFGDAVAVDPAQDNFVIMAGVYGLWKSQDAGTTWPFNGLSNTVRSLAISPNTPSNMYAGGGTGICVSVTPCNNVIYMSSDAGTTWAILGSLPTTFSQEEVAALAIDPANPTTLYAGDVAGVWQSTNGGITWSLVFPTNSISALAMQPNASQNANFNAMETVTKGVIAFAEDFKSFPTVACGVLQVSVDQIPGVVHAGLISSGQGQALTFQLQTAEASIPCP